MLKNPEFYYFLCTFPHNIIQQTLIFHFWPLNKLYTVFIYQIWFFLLNYSKKVTIFDEIASQKRSKSQNPIFLARQRFSTLANSLVAIRKNFERFFFTCPILIYRTNQLSLDQAGAVYGPRCSTPGSKVRLGQRPGLLWRRSWKGLLNIHIHLLILLINTLASYASQFSFATKIMQENDRLFLIFLLLLKWLNITIHLHWSNMKKKLDFDF